jgi:hypothetical protein
MTEQSPNPGELHSTSPEENTLENRISDLRSKISDLAVEIDTHKANIARCAGGGVFLFALAALATYDLLTGKSGLWLSIGVTHENLLWLAIGLGGSSIAAFAFALILEKKRDTVRENHIAELERELEQLLKSKDRQTR